MFSAAKAFSINILIMFKNFKYRFPWMKSNPSVSKTKRMVISKFAKISNSAKLHQFSIKKKIKTKESDYDNLRLNHFQGA